LSPLDPCCGNANDNIAANVVTMSLVDADKVEISLMPVLPGKSRLLLLLANVPYTVSHKYGATFI